MSDPVDQQRASAGRLARLTVSGAAATPPSLHVADPGATTAPDIVTSPLRADGQGPTTGLMLMLQSPANIFVATAAPLVAASGLGFLVTVWIRDPVTRQWGSTTQFQVPYGKWMRTFDFNGGDLYLQFDLTSTTLAGNGSGNVDVHLVEL